jgi:hypothetical protein
MVKPQAWWGQFKVDPKTRNQPQVEIWMELVGCSWFNICKKIISLE